MSNRTRNIIEPDAEPTTLRQAPHTFGAQPVVIEIAIAAAMWFLAVTWFAFARSAETDYLLVIVTLFFAIFFTPFLLTASYSNGDPRWPVKRASFREFLNGTVGTATGDERGRDVLIEIALLPVTSRSRQRLSVLLG